jgi:hypothetical protein
MASVRGGWIAPVSREMILSFVAMHSLVLPSSPDDISLVDDVARRHPRRGLDQPTPFFGIDRG